MKKRVFGRKFSRNSASRRALFRGLIKALVVSGKITTTKAKAKAIQGQIDKIVNLAKEKTVFARRRLFSDLGNDEKTTNLIFTKIAPTLEGRVGGYTRVINLPRRVGDWAEMVRFEWVEKIGTSEKDDSEQSKEKRISKNRKDETRKARKINRNGLTKVGKK